MKKEFINHEIALALKELKFDEECIAFYKDSEHLKAVDQHWGSGLLGVSKSLGFRVDDLILAPTYSQTFRWFREKYGLYTQDFMDLDNKFRVKIENPWLTKGDVFNRDVIEKDVEDYPQIFQELYKFENNEQHFALGDHIYRISNKGYKDVVKLVALSEIHLKEDSDIELFPTKELAEEFLLERENKRSEKYSQQSIYHILETIVLFSNINVEKKTITELKFNLKTINSQAIEALKQLKN